MPLLAVEADGASEVRLCLVLRRLPGISCDIFSDSLPTSCWHTLGLGKGFSNRDQPLQVVTVPALSFTSVGSGSGSDGIGICLALDAFFLAFLAVVGSAGTSAGTDGWGSGGGSDGAEALRFLPLAGGSSAHWSDGAEALRFLPLAGGSSAGGSDGAEALRFLPLAGGSSANGSDGAEALGFLPLAGGSSAGGSDGAEALGFLLLAGTSAGGSDGTEALRFLIVAGGSSLSTTLAGLGGLADAGSAGFLARFLRPLVRPLANVVRRLDCSAGLTDQLGMSTLQGLPKSLSGYIDK